MCTPLSRAGIEDGEDAWLRPVEAGDFDALAEIRRDDETQAMLLAVPEAVDDDAVRTWLDRRCNDASGFFRVVADPSSREVKGYVQITDIHRRNGYGYVGIALRRAARERGLGRMGLGLLHRTAARELGLRKVLLHVRHDNRHALHLYNSCHYRTIGTLRRHFKDAEGAFHDVLILERMLDEA